MQKPSRKGMAFAILLHRCKTTFRHRNITPKSNRDKCNEESIDRKSENTP
jgi:hypothetical protein